MSKFEWVLILTVFLPLHLVFEWRWHRKCRRAHPHLYPEWTLKLGLEYAWLDFKREVLRK